MNNVKDLIFLCFLFISKVCFGQKVSDVEQKLCTLIENNYAETLDLLKTTVNINSGTLNHKGVKEVGVIYAAELEKLGFKTEWVNLPDSLNRAGHLVATRLGNKGKKLFLIGHLDTVFEESMAPNPYRILNDSLATGQGLNDMKGGDVMVIASLKALHSMGYLENRHIVIYFTGDEENAGKPSSVSRADFIARAKTCEMALGYETALGFSVGTTARRGASGWTLTTTGKQGHSAGVFTKNSGYGSIYEAARILNEFREKLSTEKYLTFNPGQIMGGTEVGYDATKSLGTTVGKTNIIAQKTIVSGDLRFISEEQKLAARVKMTKIVASNLAQTGAAIQFTDGIPAMSPTSGNRKLLEILNQTSIAMKLGEVKEGDPGVRGAGDISYIAQYLDCLDGLGASGTGAHAPGETLNLKQYPNLIKRNTVFLYRLLK
jgi:glutamate carboxypeptidase